MKKDPSPTQTRHHTVPSTLRSSSQQPSHQPFWNSRVNRPLSKASSQAQSLSPTAAYLAKADTSKRNQPQQVFQQKNGTQQKPALSSRREADRLLTDEKSGEIMYLVPSTLEDGRLVLTAENVDRYESKMASVPTTVPTVAKAPPIQSNQSQNAQNMMPNRSISHDMTVRRKPVPQDANIAAGLAHQALPPVQSTVQRRRASHSGVAFGGSALIEDEATLFQYAIYLTLFRIAICVFAWSCNFFLGASISVLLFGGSIIDKLPPSIATDQLLFLLNGPSPQSCSPRPSQVAPTGPPHLQVPIMPQNPYRHAIMPPPTMGMQKVARALQPPVILRNIPGTFNR
ncbi:hypothetical protein V1511DRAFT_495096 [Dipodascopsis uninucleata]